MTPGRDDYEPRRRRYDGPTWKWVTALVLVILGSAISLGVREHLAHISKIETTEAVHDATIAAMGQQVKDIHDDVAEIKRLLTEGAPTRPRGHDD